MQNVAHPSATRQSAEEAGQGQPVFGRVDSARPYLTAEGPDFERIQRSEQFITLKKRLRRFIFPMSLLFFVWYMVYVLLAAYAPSFMGTKLFGEINIGLIFGILQFVTTIAITAAYIRFANRQIDPQVERIRRHVGVSD
jgi:uncharacterized membrane protein (DUF485 family)